MSGYRSLILRGVLCVVSVTLDNQSMEKSDNDDDDDEDDDRNDGDDDNYPIV